MAPSYILTAEPVRISLGRAGRARVRASVPFMVNEALLCCAEHPHLIDIGRHTGVFRALGDGGPGVIRVSPQGR